MFGEFIHFVTGDRRFLDEYDQKRLRHNDRVDELKERKLTQLHNELNEAERNGHRATARRIRDEINHVSTHNYYL